MLSRLFKAALNTAADVAERTAEAAAEVAERVEERVSRTLSKPEVVVAVFQAEQKMNELAEKARAAFGSKKKPAAPRQPDAGLDAFSLDLGGDDLNLEGDMLDLADLGDISEEEVQAMAALLSPEATAQEECTSPAITPKERAQLEKAAGLRIWKEMGAQPVPKARRAKPALNKAAKKKASSAKAKPKAVAKKKPAPKAKKPRHR